MILIQIKSLESNLEAKIIKLQNKLSKNVISQNFLPKKIKTVCGVDVSYTKKLAFCSAVILDNETLEPTKNIRIVDKISSPYIPSFFMLRESPPILKALNTIRKDFDILFIDGHGRLHPRLCGLACYIGIQINKPTIGIAKKLLCGKIRDDSTIEFNGKILGYEIKHNKKKFFVSVGHKINLRTAVRITKKLTTKQWYPEPLRLADLDSREFRRSYSKT